MGKGSWVMESGFRGTTFGQTFMVLYISTLIFYLALGRIPKEDAALRKQLRKKWDDWAKKVPCSMFPGIY